MEADWLLDGVESIQLDADTCQRQLSRLRMGQERHQCGGRSGSGIGAAVRDHRGGLCADAHAHACARAHAHARADVHPCGQRRPDHERARAAAGRDDHHLDGDAHRRMGALVYKWFVNDGGLWKQIGSWTASNQFSWTPTLANANYRVSAWVKSATNTADEAEAASEQPFAITAAGSAPTPTPAPAPTPVPTSARVASVALTTNVPAPQPAATTITWTASPTGGSGALVYKWFVNDGGLWKQIGSWTASNQFSWTPTLANANYRVSAWVKSATNTADEAEAASERPFAITAAGSAPTPTPTPVPTSARVASVALTTNVPAPQPAASTITWTATPTGGSGALVYKWFVNDGGLWKQIGSWTASNQFSWTPALANANYRVSAWVKSAANAADEAEAASEQPFAITAAGSAPAPPPVPTSTRVAGVTLSTNVPAPQRAGSTIAWTATPTGGSWALLYKWFVFDGALWKPIGSWTASNQLSWTPTAANANYRVSVWVKSAANAADEPEAASERPFAITAP